MKLDQYIKEQAKALENNKIHSAELTVHVNPDGEVDISSPNTVKFTLVSNQN